MGLKILIGIGVFLAVAIAIAILIGRFLKKVEEDVEQWEEPLHREFKIKEQFRKLARGQCKGDADAMADPEQYTTPSKVQINLDIDDVDID